MAVPPDWSANYARNNHAIVISASDIRAICPYCKNASTFVTRAQHYFHRNGDGHTEAHLILECNYARCKRIIYVRTDVGPSTNRNRPDDPFFMYPSRAVDAAHQSVPTAIAEDWIEAQIAMQAAAPKAAAVMFRRVLYGVLMDKGCKLHPLKEGLEELIQGQRLPAIFDEWLPAIRDDGHDGAHPDRALQVSAENLVETMEYTSELLRFLYVEPYEFKQRKSRSAKADASTTTTTVAATSLEPPTV